MRLPSTPHGYKTTMYEIRSNGTVLDICRDTFTANLVFESSPGAHVELLKYNERGQKVVVQEKFNHLKQSNSRSK